MCFTNNDYDWIANVTEESTATASKDIKCDECRRTIPAGVAYHHIHQQESEWCKDCENGDCECVGDCCQCEHPSTGESFDYDRCLDCNKFLQAVENAELAAGCSISDSRPPLGEMRDTIHECKYEAEKYWRQAAKDYPELVKSGYLGWLWRRTFYVDDMTGKDREGPSL